MFTRLSLVDDGGLLAELQWKRERSKISRRLCVSNDNELRQTILREAHVSPYSMHPRGNMMYQDVKSEHFLPARMDYSLQKLTNLYIFEIVRLHEVPISIISYRDSYFTFIFWKKLQELLGTHLDFSTAFYPQSDGKSERVFQILEDMLRGCIIGFQGSWVEHLPLAKFSYNNSFCSIIQMAPYEALYESERKIRLIQERLKVASDRQKSYTDLKRKDIEYNVDKQVFLKVSPW
ncbi:reverse transcriptase [Gossypium australe]|uniref:Reverse transcriptase n=1 Tax=Gossypium australe TaxID=47621 RepID=A0A5B6UUV6_9ROSI|nr:reverse transcriptase [Gossypium australe]